MKRLLPFTLFTAASLLAGCSGDPDPVPEASEAAAEASVTMASASAVPLAAPTPEEPALDLPRKFRATGTEPFWGADVDGETLKYSTPEFPEGTSVTVTRKQAGASVTFTGTIDGKPLELVVSSGPCSDGMSDRVYPFSVTRTIGPDIERGCARAG